MSMSIYLNNFREIVSESKRKLTPQLRLQYLVKQTQYFMANHINPDADRIIAMLNSEIEQARFDIQNPPKITETNSQLAGLPCKDTIKEEDLKFIFNKLFKKPHKSVNETNFIKTFQAESLPDNWQRLKWTGSNPELATMVYMLTGEKPVPSMVTKYFEPKFKYTNASSKRTNNERVTKIITAALK